MSSARETFDARFQELIEETANHKLHEDSAGVVMKNLRTFAECRPDADAPEPELAPVPETRWEKVKDAAAKVWDHETTRVAIKTAGSFAGVGLVVYSTIRRDHVLERQALGQANQRNS